MSDNCGGGCSSCGETCSSRQEEQSLLIEQNSKSNIKKIIGVVSGKGSRQVSATLTPIAPLSHTSHFF